MNGNFLAPDAVNRVDACCKENVAKSLHFAQLDGNRLMLYGGYTGAIWSASAEIYNASANTWSFTESSGDRPT